MPQILIWNIGSSIIIYRRPLGKSPTGGGMAGGRFVETTQASAVVASMSN